MYYFDHSATTPVHPDVLDLMHSIQKNVYGNPSSVHSQGKKAKSLIETARKQIANTIGANPNQIIFTSGGTEANNQVFWSLLRKEKKHVISNSIEHPAVLKVLSELSTHGIDYTLIPVNKKGRVSSINIQNAFNENTCLVSIMLANNEVGTIQPIKDLAKLAHEQNALFHTDAVQCLGKIPINVVNLDVDYLSLSAHKFYGPKGIGVLYFKNKEAISSLMIGGGQESGFRAGTENIASIAGMGLAAELATLHLENHVSELISFESHFKTGLLSFFPNVIFNGDMNNKLPGLVSVSLPGYRSDILLAKLDRANMAVSSGSACGSGNLKPSHILSEMGIDDKTNISTLRFSFGASNSLKQIEQLLSKLQSILTD
ncbi:MAG: cysteine desulfurase [Candidatus Marinimicrobia bacterium]|jgi:cysteine desulfurase|nr:cysteine desulfurase [Candidatus Neomarinimicrobiota bacterium]MBT3500703.1 cysteine desulfurase [Candidatus Neomarinimicrobiota bacterium]MBT3839551.1 cysteine desulfurase [Candidatus Neomarinimicrobiota bacterium]MBT3998919.1 cysteine desulfurase [Candidatus Neomarinimicrobiota bacterium]MBT4282870.1 cysteine desulfurase [Candidatus Neomarinimicrobiota bacterium]